MDREGRERERERVYKVILVNKKRDRESEQQVILITKVFVIWQNIYKKMNWMLIILWIV